MTASTRTIDAKRQKRSQANEDEKESQKRELLDQYFFDLRDVNPLPPEEQTELARRFHEEGDRAAGQRLIATNLKLVAKLAHEYKKKWSELPDLIQAGNVGLTKALEEFNPEEEIRFTSYAQYWIRAKIMKHLKRASHPVKIYSNCAGRKLFYHLDKTEKRLQKEGEEPTAERIAEELDVPEEDVRKIGETLKNPPVSLDQEITENKATTFGDLLVSPQQDPEELAEEFEVVRKVRRFVETFTNEIEEERNRDIWLNRTTSTSPKTLRELGAEWDISKERIRQLEIELVERAKKRLKSEFGDELEEFVASEGFKSSLPEPYLS